MRHGSPRTAVRYMVIVLLMAVCSDGFVFRAAAVELNRFGVKRYPKLRETERYQLEIAMNYGRQKNWKVAMAEFEKYVTLYETSEAASYAQLQWAHCLVNQRRSNTAIKEGYQSVIDYWPDSPDAILAAYYIGSTYKGMGDLRKAKKAYKEVLEKHPEHTVAVYSINDLIAISGIEKDLKTRVELWKRLTFDTKRTRDSSKSCETASRSLADYYFSKVAYAEGVKALEQTYGEERLPKNIMELASSQIRSLVRDTKTTASGVKLADLVISDLRKRMNSDAIKASKRSGPKKLYFHIASLYGDSGRQSRVPSVYDEMVKKFGVDDEILSSLASWYKGQKRYDDARKTYARYKDAIAGKNQIALSYREQKNYAGAEATYRQLSGIDKEKEIHWIAQIPAAYREGKNVKMAVTVYQELINRDAENVVKWTGETAATYRENRMYKEAIEVYTQLLKIDPGQTVKWLKNIATAHHDARQYKEAIAFYRQCVDDTDNKQRMASCHRQLKQYKEAEQLYGQIVGTDPRWAAWALLEIGYTREQAGKKEVAIQAFQVVCKRFPKSTYASRAHAHLQNVYKISVTLGGAKDE